MCGLHSWRGLTDLDLLFVMDSHLGTWSIDGPSILWGDLQDKMNILTNKATIQKRTKVDIAILHLQWRQRYAAT